MNFDKLSEPLPIEDVEFRVQSINKGGYATILAYKSARVDINRLNAVCGPLGWQREHSRENHNCTVSIWDAEHQHWVSKEDTGTESSTEKQKGLASDSFKRACFNWGIGIELYDYPFISIKLNDNEFEVKKGNDGRERGYATWNLKLKEWTWFSEFDEDGMLVRLSAVDDKGNTRFNYKLKVVGHRFKKGEANLIIAHVKEALIAGDEVGLKQILDEYKEEAEKMKVWGLFTSAERASIKALLEDQK